MGQLKPRTHAGNNWTKARYFQFIRSVLRQAFQRYPVKQIVKNENRKPVVGKRHKWVYTCEHCEGEFMDKEIQVDHIKPTGSLNEYSDLPGFVQRLYCEKADMQILCKPCHLIKTANERRERNK